MDEQSRLSHKNRWGFNDFIFIAMGWAAILAGCLTRGRPAPMWMDEIVAFRLIKDPSVVHSVKALADQCDGVPPFYYLVARLWGAIFSVTPISLRLFSAVCICAAFGLIWIVLRRHFSFWPSALAIAFAFGSCNTIRFEIANVRFYGFFLALIALAILIALNLASHERPSLALLIANTINQAALVLCHPFGGLYGAFILLALVVLDFRRKRKLRLTVIASYVIGWLFLLLWFRSMLHQMAVNSPHGWVPAPLPSDLIAGLNDEIDYYPLILIFPVAWLFHLFTRREPDHAPAKASDPDSTNNDFYILVPIALLGVIPLTWILSRVSPDHSLWVPRYFIGTVAAWSVILAQLVTYGVRSNGRSLTWPVKLFAILLIVVGLRPLFAGHKEFFSYEDATGEVDEAFGHYELPVLLPSQFDFLPREFYSKEPSRYYFPLDWPVAVAPTAEPMAVSEYKLLDALRRNYPNDYDHVVQADQFLREHDTFLVHDPGREWVKLRLTPDLYTITVLGEGKNHGWKMLLVQKKTAAAR